MFDSGISAKALIAELQSEVDVALPITNSTYATWLNSLQWLLYSGIIKEQNDLIITEPQEGVIQIASLDVSDNEAPIRFEDIYAVYADTTQLIKTSITSGFVFPDCFYKKGDNLAVKMQKTPNFIKLIYHIKPKLIKVNENDEIQDGNVMIPIEFIELVKSKLRGEAYSLENEYGPASNWLNNYNILLENFKQWLSDKAQQFGQ